MAWTGRIAVIRLLTLDCALERLRELNERMFRVVELRVFSGMTMLEIA